MLCCGTAEKRRLVPLQVISVPEIDKRANREGLRSLKNEHLIIKMQTHT